MKSGFTPWISVALTGVYVVAAPSAGGSFRRRPAAYTYNSGMDEVCVLRLKIDGGFKDVIFCFFKSRRLFGTTVSQ